MRIIIDDKLIAQLKPDLTSRSILLNQFEVAILQKAEAICEKAGKLQENINHLENIPDDYNDFEWARIYLADILMESKQ